MRALIIFVVGVCVFVLGAFYGSWPPLFKQTPPPPIYTVEEEGISQLPPKFILPEGIYFYDSEEVIGLHVPAYYMAVQPSDFSPAGMLSFIGYTGHIAHGGRPTFSQLLPENRGYINVKIRTVRFAKQAEQAVRNWQELARAHIGRDLFRIVPSDTPHTEYEVEIIDQGMESDFGAWFTSVCTNFTQDAPWAWAGVWTYLEHSSMVCLNPNKPNDAGVLAHELGHVLGLGELSQIMYTETYFVLGSCPKDRGAKSIMAYNYPLPWKKFWPADLRPTKEDLLGPWVCDSSIPGGNDAIYGYTQSPGMGGPFVPQVPVVQLPPPPPSSPEVEPPLQNTPPVDATPPPHEDAQTPISPDMPERPVYIVKRGDMLSGIAECFDIPLWELIALNPERENPSLIHLGNRIYLP